jgi:hypothetical protein
VVVKPLVNAVGYTTDYWINFTTATAGVIANITMEFPAGFGVSAVTLKYKEGIGAGNVFAVGQKVYYNVTSPADVPAGTDIKIKLGNIKNTDADGTYVVTVRTLDTTGTEIDSGSASFEIAAISSPTLTPNFGPMGSKVKVSVYRRKLHPQRLG